MAIDLELVHSRIRVAGLEGSETMGSDRLGFAGVGLLEGSSQGDSFGELAEQGQSFAEGNIAAEGKPARADRQLGSQAGSGLALGLAVRLLKTTPWELAVHWIPCLLSSSLTCWVASPSLSL